jgi:hypothetical protein
VAHKYLSKADLKRMIQESRAADAPTTELLDAVRLIAERMYGRFNFRVPLDDVQQECCIAVLLWWRNIDRSQKSREIWV